MKTSTRVLAGLISIVMLLGMFPGVTLAADGEGRVAGPVVVADPESPTGYTGQFTYYDAAAQQVYFCGDLNLSNYADQTDTKVYSPQEYKPGLMRRGGSQFKVAMENLGDGWWYYELPLAAGANQYWFTVDNGRRMMPDPANHPNWSPNSNESSKDAYNCIYVPYDEKQDNELLKAREVELPREGEDKGSWEYVPYTLNDRTFYMGVYLPYGYDAERAEPYKTIYLIHGFGQDESDWMGIGSAPNIMDNLVAEGRTEAAVLVALPNNNNSIGSQSDRFAALFNTVLPFVEENYNVSKDYMDRSVAGLSMGSRYSKYIMETDPLSFGYYGLFSCSETVKTETENIDKAHVFIGLGVYDGANYQNATTTNTQNMAEGFFEETVYVAGAHDFNTWSQLFRIYAEDYLWKPWAFGDGEAPEEPEPGTEKGLVLKYDFKSLENGTIVEDISGNGKAAEVMPRGSGVQTREVEIYGQPKTAIVIAGGTPSEGHNYVELPVGVLNDLESVTISCWAYVNRTVSYGRIWDFGSNTTAYMYLLDAGGNTGHRGYTTALTASGWSNEIGPEKGSNLATRTWKLTTVTFDGATREISLYEDGEKIGTSVAAVGLDRLYGSTQNWIGYGQFKDNMFNGMIADFRIYDYAMSEAEVAAMFDIPDSDRVQRDYNSLSLGNTQNLESNLSLPTSGAAKSSIEWTSSDPGVITAAGVITRPAPGQPNGAATLTARIFYGDAEMEKTFDVTVQAMPTDAERVSYDAAAIDLGGLSGVIADLRLPTKGAKDSAITWASSDPAHLSETGKVTRPVGDPATVTLTATVSYGEASETREFTATILPVYEKLDAVKAEQVSVTTKVGIAPALPAMVLTTFEDGSKRMVKATWPTALSGADFAEAKEYTVLGRLVDFDVEVAATVTAVEELETPAAEAKLLKLSDVTLDGDDTIYAQNMGRALEYLKVMDADRMLYNFRSAFGQDTKGAQALAGWDEPTGLLRGHSTGHFMSALAEAYASTGDEEYKQKLDYMIDSMRELQLLSKGKASEFKTACTPSDAAQSKWSTDPNTWGEGFISAYSPDQFALLEQYTPYATIWAPYYTMHKLLSGFLDSYVYAGNETGLQIAKDLGLWVYDRLSACTPEQRTKMWAMYIAGEYGGMNEVLARLYEITGDERLLTASRMFDNTVFFDGLAENKDTIQGRHANQHIPQIVGAIHEYAATGDPYYYNVAKNFWEMATARYAYSIGGVGTGESFKQPYRQGNNITGSSSRGENCETCAAYNMLKLTRDIYVYDPDNAAYMDYYERTVLNQIAASQSHNSTSRMHNGCTYMLPIDPGQRKTYDSDYGGFTCCNGTGMENHVIYQIAAYAKTDDTLYVNLYMPSTAEWEEKGVTVKQETQFPSEDSKLTVSGSGSFKMKIRVPYWATAGFVVKVNGETVCTAPEPSSYVEIDRVWADGDVVDIHMPYILYLDKTPDTVDGSVVASLMYGPIVMVAKDNRSRYTAMNWYTLNLNDTNLEKAVSIVEPAGTGNVPHFVIEGLDFYPMYDAYNYRYHAYVKLMAPESVLNPEYLEQAVADVASLSEADFSAGDWAKFQAALADARALLENPAATQLELFDAQQALEDAAAKAGEPEIPDDQKGLKDFFKDYFRIGTATEVAQVNSEVGREFMLKHFNSVTCENDMKPQHTLDQAGSQAAGDNVTVKVQLNDNARTILKFCEDNGIPMRGHVLCWHSQTPGWLFREGFDANGDYVSPEIMDQRLESYIKNYFELLATEFPNLTFYSFDVVNEAFTDTDPATMRTASQSGWISVYGDETFIYKAFELAHKYKPEGCLLAYNDYNEYNDGKVDAIYNLAKDLYEKGWLDALGMQGHLTVPDNPTIARFRAALEKFSTIGCKIMVTELDAQRGSGGDLEQAEYYQELFETLVEFSDKIEAVVFWGNHDGVSWRRTSYPLLFDSNYQPKEAYYAVLDSIADHEHVFERTVIEPTCTEEGQVIDTCTICGRTIVRERPKKLGHDWDEGVITTPPTETETGVRTYTCKRCGEKKTGRVPRIGATTPDDIDFTNPADADKFEVVNKDTAEIASGIGLTLTPTADAFEPIGGGFGGGAATESEPKDLIKIPVSGDWTATLKFDYDPNNVTFAFSTYFSFLAMEGDDYQNMAGIRATNSVAQDYLRKDGEIATPTVSGGGFGQQGPQTGFTAAGTFYYKMEKAGDSYTFYRGVPAGTRGPEDVEFEEIFKLEETGIEAEYIVIDAYKTSTFSFGGTDSWLFTLQSLEFEDGGAPAEQLKPGPNVVKDPASPTGYTVKFLYENPDAQSVVFAGDIGLRNWADTSDETSYTPFEYQPGFMRAGSWQADMVKREDGYWYIEVPLAAGANQYWFYVDGNTRRMMPDPNNAPKWSPASSATKNAYNAVYVPYDEKQNFEPMKAREAENPRADQKGSWEYVPIQIGETTRYMGVYTPYGYDPEGDKVYKTIYAVHGGGQDESDWMGIGSVQNIMDNLAAEGRTEPAFIVTPASANFGTDFANLFGVMVAYMEENFKVSSDPQDRAFCGLSAGGGQTRSLIISSHADQFGYYGPWSSSNTNDGYSAAGDLSTAHIMFGVGYHDPMERRHLTEATMNELKDKGAYVVNEVVAGAHDFNAWCQLFRIFCEKYLWQPEAFGDTGEPEIPDSEKGLKDFFKDYFRIGTATEVAQVNSEVGREFMLKHFNSVTCENDMKPQHTLDQAGSQAAGDNVTVKVQLNDNARTILKFCEDNGIPMRGHVLCWHSQTPAWLFREGFDANGDYVSPEIMDQRLESYIKNYFELLATEFPNLTFYSFDVVNEAFTDTDPATMRTPSNSGWISVYGDETFIYKAFELAHKYKPEGCLLAYNDYNEYNDGKVDAIYNLAKDLYEKGWLDALGMQGHLTVPDNPTIARFRAALEKFSTIGCKIMVTELDAQRGSGGDLEQAEYYQQLFETLVEFSDKIEAVVFWGNHDGVSWRRTSYPLLFDSNYQPKEAYYAVLDSIADHEHEFERTVIEPTCTEEGQVIDTCTICGRTIVRERPKKLGHDWDEGVITTPPTETETGVRTYTCKRCGETKTGRVPRIGATTPDDIDFTNPADADKFEVVNKDTAEIASGIGLTLTPTADAFEPIGGGFGGGAATESEPKDLIKIPVSGDWTATLKFDYDPNNVTFAFSTYFSFLAMEGDDYQNMAGIRATNSVAQDYLRKDGEIATPTISSGFGQQGPQTGFTAAGTFYYKMEKAGDSYTFYRGVPAGTRGPEDVEFEEIFKLEETGIEAEYIVIDAYKTSTFSFGGTDSWLFTLKSLNFDEGGAPGPGPGPGQITGSDYKITAPHAVKLNGTKANEGDGIVVTADDTIEKITVKTAAGEDVPVKKSGSTFTFTMPASDVQVKTYYAKTAISALQNVRQQGNPFIPIYDFNPDTEPHIWEDPDNPGQYRFYFLSSHDMDKNHYCSTNHVLYSCPVDDPFNWTYHGIIVGPENTEHNDILYAPDMCCVEDPSSPTGKYYYYYPCNQGSGRSTMVLRSSRPDGKGDPFTVINWADESHNRTAGSIMTFDPSVFVDDDGKVYGYWGGYNSSCHAAQLDETMYNAVPGTQIDDIFEGDGVRGPNFGFFEASSMRKIGDTYVFVYSTVGKSGDPASGNYNHLAYAYSKSPLGPFTYGGVIVNATAYGFYGGGNTHGSLIQLDGQWYITYHRNVETYARQAMISPVDITIEEDGTVKITEAEVTSEGFYINGLNPYAKVSLGTASYTRNCRIRPLYEDTVKSLPIINVVQNTVVGVTYFDFNTEGPEGASSVLNVDLIPNGVDATMNVWVQSANVPDTQKRTFNTANATKIGEIKITSDMAKEMTTLSVDTPYVDQLDGRYGVYFTFSDVSGSGNIAELYDMQFEFSDHEHELEETVVAPTCLDKGYTLGICKICGKTFKYDYTDALGHDWDDGVVTVKPTPTTPGVRTFTCSRCGETKTARIPRTGSSAPDDIDFTKADDAGKFELVNQAQSAIAEGEGLALIATRPAFEDCKGQNSGDQATTPEDVVKVPVSGDWTATLTVDFDTNGARNGYYQFFGFYAAQGEDYQNLAGIRGGDGAMQNFERHNGEITHQDEDGVNSAPGFASAGTYYLRIEKEGDTYTCYRSEDGENFTEMFAYPESGIEADYIVIDAYTGMTEGYKFTLKSLEFEGGAVPMAWVLAETVEAGGQYVIVSNGYALTNRVAEVSTAYGRTSLASTPVTVENEIITSEVSEDMIWDFTAATSSSNNGFETGYVLTSGDSKYLARNGPTNGNPAPLNTQTYDASNYDTKPQYCYWVVEDLDDAGNKAVFCTGTGEWSFALRGSAEGFDAPGNSSAATIVSQNPVQLYELIGKPVEPEEPEGPDKPIEYPDLPIYQNKYDYSFAERAADLLARMSLTQKGSMLVENSPAILAENLGGGALNVPATLDISHYCWWSEALHGFLRDNEQPQTDGSRDNVSYAQSLTMASTWNPALYYEGAILIADEIRERAVKNELGNCINLDFYSPTINMQRDPRWGRNEESYSEDPYLTAVMGSEFVFGMEGKDREGNMLDPDGYYKTMTTIKHYVANNTEAIRQSGGATSDLRALREYYAAPYRDIIQKADCRSVMTAYSSFNGEPCSYSSYLMDTLLRQTYGLSGFITSDCDSVSTMSNLSFVNPRTGEKLTNVEQWGGALAHGEDLECNSGGRSDYRRLTKDMVDNAVQTDKGTFTENTIDVSAHRLLTARISTGELDLENGWTAAANERKADQEARGINNYTPERIAVVDQEVDEGVVMLKNDGILPLQIPASGAYKAVIIGEHQNSSYLGLYSSEQRHAEDDKWRIWIGPGIEQAILAKDPDSTVTRIAKNSLTEEEEALVKAADVVIVVTGTGNRYAAEGRDRSTIVLPDNQAQLISSVGKMNPNTVAVMETCGPMQVTQFENDVKAILWSSFGGIRKGVGFGHVLTGVVNPSGHLTSTWHQNDSDMPGIRDYNLYATNGSHGRTYMYYDNTVPVSYPFGYGLSYTTFEYSNLKIDRTAYDANDTVKVTFDVKNTGAVTGKDVAQLYIAQPDAPAELLRPIRRLKGFDKFELAPGETKTVSLEVAIPDLAYYNEEKDQFEVDTGRYQVQVGEDSAHANLTADFTVSGTMDEYPVVLTAKPNQEGDQALGIEQRVIFDMGATINPQLTVAMNNEKLYGYIIADQQDLVKSLSSTPLPEGMKFTYKSNRPSVASCKGGVIKALMPGVATITVTGELNGHVVTTDFVVYVMASADVDSITVDGQPLEGFARDQYSYELDYSGEGMPVVAAISSNPDLEVTVKQMTGLPGVAEVVSVSKSTGTTATYRIGAGPAPVSTDFSEGWAAAQAKGWQVIEPTENAAFGENGLTITTEPGALGSGQKNLYYEPAFGSWVAQTHISLNAPLSQDGPQIGLLAYDDNSSYINYCISQVTTTSWGRTTISRVLRVYAVDNGEQTQVASVTLGEGLTDIYLQMVKRGKIYAFNYSLDGENWTAVSGTAVLKAVYPKLTVYASGSTVEGVNPIEATYDGINVFKVTDLYPRLSSIKADGETIPGFDPETFVYNYEIERGTSKVPVLTAAAADPDHTVEISQLDKVTGMATVTVTSGAATKEYLVAYNYAPSSDYFADGSISDDWTILKEDPEGYSIEKGKGVVMPTQYGDIRAADTYSTSWKNLFTAPAMGIAWEIVAKVVFPVKPNANTQTNEFLIFQDDANYIYQGLSNPLRVTYGSEVNNTFTSNNSGWFFSGPSAVAAEDDSVTLYLSYKYSNGSYLLSWSQDGQSFQSLATVSNVNLANPMIGLFATERGTVEPVNVQYEYIAVTSLNTIEQMNYTEMLTWAAQNAADYIAADLPDETAEDLVLSAAPHGYTVTLSSSDPAVIDAEGKVTPSVDDRNVTVTVTVSEGATTASASKTVRVPGTGSGSLDLDALYRLINEAIAKAEAAQAKAEEAIAAAEAAGGTDLEALNAALAAARAAKSAAEQAMSQAEAAKVAAESADRDAAAQAALAAADAARAAEDAAKAAQALAAAQAAQAAAEAAEAAAKAAQAEAASNKEAADAAVAAAQAAKEAAQAALEAAHAADLEAAERAAAAALSAAESARAQAAAQAAQAAAEAAEAAAKAAQAKAEAAQANAAADEAAAKAAKEAAESAKAAAENAKAAAEAAKTAAEGSNTSAAQNAAKAAASAAEIAKAMSDLAAAQAEIAAIKAAAEQSALEAAAALAAAEAAKAQAEAAQLNAYRLQAKTQLAGAGLKADPAVKAAVDAIKAAAADAIDSAADQAAIDAILAKALEKIIALEDADCPSKQFSDVPPVDNWAHAGIDYCVKNGLMNGFYQDQFAPDVHTTRAQFATILYRVAGSPDVEYKATFSDVPNGLWYSDAIEWAAANGIVNGVGGGRFSPDGKITREQIAAILYRYSGSPKVEGDLSAFGDAAAVSPYAKDAMIWAVKVGVINGVGTGSGVQLQPAAYASRAQIATIFARFLEQ